MGLTAATVARVARCRAAGAVVGVLPGTAGMHGDLNSVLPMEPSTLPIMQKFTYSLEKENMAIGVDTSKWKPRKIKGTPAAKFRNVLAFGILGFGIASGLFFHFAKVTENLRKAAEVLYEDPIEEVERRLMIASGLPNSPKVKSKYFSFTRNHVMDESLSAFQEKKSARTGPKTNEKPSSSSTKVKKTKHIKGQKDIRTALKSNKHELLKYTEEFDKVCKESGLDVDTEQLLLAVALSKSLQKIDSLEEVSTSNACSQRSGKIRSTLQEYGFTVPEIKISRKSQKCRKNFKLLLSTETEKQQIISDRYAQILFNNSDFYIDNHNKLINCNKNLYFKATNIPYSEIKNNDAFYIDNLVEKSLSNGSLLRNWSDIPGRPSSPTDYKNLKMDFSEIECSQDELDIVLSGSLKSTKNIIKNKVQTSVSRRETISDKLNLNNDIGGTDFEVFVPYDNIVLHAGKETGTLNDEHYTPSGSSVLDKMSDIISNVARSCSPDIFDDESSIADNRENKHFVYAELIDNIIKDNSTPCELIDLTQNTDDVIDKSLKSSENTNFTRRHSNDVMEITECVAYSIPLNLDNKILNEDRKLMPTKENPNSISQLSHSSNKTKRISNDYMEITDCVIKKSISEQDMKRSIDLTQISDEDNVHETINGIPISCELKNPLANESMNESLDDTIILNDNEIHSDKHCQIVSLQTHENELSENGLDVNVTNVLDKNTYSIKRNQTFFDEFEVNHSEVNVENNTSVVLNICKGNEDKIDLTQSSDSSSEGSVKESDLIKFNLSGHGNKDEVSVDYDDLYDMIQERRIASSNNSNISHESKVTKHEDPNSSKASSQSSNQNSIAFEVIDQELNYSLNISKCEIPLDNFGCISFMDHSSKIENSKKSQGTIKSPVDESMTNSFLPDVDIKQSTAYIKPIPNKTPERDLTKTKIISVTPACSDYIIKADVTPMLDYASMSTPEMNKELDKYGLKPFKRKQAVQLLNHLYNQTHPLIQSSSEAISSPPKKRKSSKTSPRKCSNSPIKNFEACNKENHLYNITNDVPDIVTIECSEEDWVFPKREKAKIHSCRVPLHIALHNYISCRRSLREAILRYEPVNIDDIHKGLVAIGFRYDPKELLRFMDKKCITVKTADNNARNKR
ncbi:unnamed protein product [Diatraea saccharalis]|uniref:Structure-specific endonuclease subunit SLX4 n=1 Tax=Diatraea saccharalis TaxID=40085 RepID=A0A9N9R9N9_9NEOP|nr:unnamed protein product [Diatraea saccharalis]